MLRIAIISDIHGNLPAMKAVLDDIRSFNADQIYCLGDLTDAAPWHNEVIELIRRMRIPTIMGNHDERIAFDHPILPLSKHSPEEQVAREKAINYTKDTITRENKLFLAHLPRYIQLDFGHLKLLLAHGSTRSVDEYIYQHHNEEELIGLMNDQQINLLVTGHTHLSYIRFLENGEKMVVNAGSVGRTKEKDGLATYLQLTIKDNNASLAKDYFNVAIKKINYPVKETIEGIKESQIPDFYAALLSDNSLAV
ncbi:putative phosphoesterase [Chitinophaga niastensis]|uniref:Putative phosphoesterase n=1 Tax=Chitinophaga niastensis TaxID=536980 RepID=A0A2P8HHC3_CHINA|nr:metallophosphoesterase family protein [Chitinophaga niastensis]PSL45615.1 putative phosphoesterase [Chitinophaga niastensis]